MAIVYLGLGSNLGNRKRAIARAIERLPAHAIRVIKVSSVIETKAVGGPPQRKFLNAVLKTTTNLTPHQLLAAVKHIEKDLGRMPTVRNGPRAIDIDILLYDRKKIEGRRLVIPHPRMHARDFVMTPLFEIAPNAARQIAHVNKQKSAPRTRA